MSYAIGVLGATGQVGREFLRILDEGDRPDLPIGLDVSVTPITGAATRASSKKTS